MNAQAFRPMILSHALQVVCFAGLGAAPLVAQEYCVGCTGPTAIYRCVIDRAAPVGPPLKTLCAGFLAREGGHASCAVRSGTVFDCDGPVRRIDAPSAAAALSGSPPVTPKSDKGAQSVTKPSRADPASRQQAEPTPRPTDSAPRTVEEAARDMTKASGETLQRAGDTIGGSARKAWGCVTSLFKSC